MPSTYTITHNGAALYWLMGEKPRDRIPNEDWHTEIAYLFLQEEAIQWYTIRLNFRPCSLGRRLLDNIKELPPYEH